MDHFDHILSEGAELDERTQTRLIFLLIDRCRELEAKVDMLEEMYGFDPDDFDGDEMPKPELSVIKGGKAS